MQISYESLVYLLSARVQKNYTMNFDGFKLTIILIHACNMIPYTRVQSKLYMKYMKKASSPWFVVSGKW